MSNDLADSPAERRRLKTRGAILTAAERVFAREGADGLSIRRLAEKIDYSPAAIYKYFTSKDELLDELKEAFFSRIMEQVHQMFDTSRPFAERARDCMATYVRTAIEKPNHYAAAFSGQLQNHELPIDDEEVLQTQKGQAFAFLSGMVGQGIEEGYFRPELEATNTAKSLWASVHGLAIMYAHMPTFPAMRKGEDSPTIDEFIEFHADLLVRGLEA